MGPGSAQAGTHEWRRGVGEGAASPARGTDRVRCACRRCGSHAHAVVLKQTIGGFCSTCGSYDLVPVAGWPDRLKV